MLKISVLWMLCCIVLHGVAITHKTSPVLKLRSDMIKARTKGSANGAAPTATQFIEDDSDKSEVVVEADSSENGSADEDIDSTTQTAKDVEAELDHDSSSDASSSKKVEMTTQVELEDEPASPTATSDDASHTLSTPVLKPADSAPVNEARVSLHPADEGDNVVHTVAPGSDAVILPPSPTEETITPSQTIRSSLASAIATPPPSSPAQPETTSPSPSSSSTDSTLTAPTASPPASTPASDSTTMTIATSVSKNGLANPAATVTPESDTPAPQPTTTQVGLKQMSDSSEIIIHHEDPQANDNKAFMASSLAQAEQLAKQRKAYEATLHAANPEAARAYFQWQQQQTQLAQQEQLAVQRDLKTQVMALQQQLEQTQSLLKLQAAAPAPPVAAALSQPFAVAPTMPSQVSGGQSLAAASESNRFGLLASNGVNATSYPKFFASTYSIQPHPDTVSIFFFTKAYCSGEFSWTTPVPPNMQWGPGSWMSVDHATGSANSVLLCNNLKPYHRLFQASVWAMPNFSGVAAEHLFNAYPGQCVCSGLDPTANSVLGSWKLAQI